MVPWLALNIVWRSPRSFLTCILALTGCPPTVSFLTTLIYLLSWNFLKKGICIMVFFRERQRRKRVLLVTSRRYTVSAQRTKMYDYWGIGGTLRASSLAFSQKRVARHVYDTLAAVGCDGSSKPGSGATKGVFRSARYSPVHLRRNVEYFWRLRP